MSQNDQLQKASLLKKKHHASSSSSTSFTHALEQILAESPDAKTIDLSIEEFRELKESVSKELEELSERLNYEASLNVGLKESLHRFRTIQDMCETIARSRKIPEIIATFLKMIPKILTSKAAAVYLQGKKTGSFEIKAKQDFTQQHQDIIKSHFEDGIITWMFTEKRPVVIPYLKDVTLHSNSSSKGFVIVPLISGEQQLGFVEIWHDAIQQIQRETQLGILDLLSRQVAIAIENCMLYEQLKATNSLLKKSQQQVVTSEKMAAIGVLASGMAHEINNPLQVIFSKVQLLQRREQNEKTKTSLEAIERQAMRISNIVTSVLRNARNQNHSELQATDVHMIVQDVLTVAYSKLLLQNIDVKCEFAGKTPKILGNAGELTQVFTNLIENARHAMKTGGILSIKSKIRGRFLLIHVEDTGSGISEEHLNRIFEPFFTTKEPNEGTGLGLFLCYQIIERHKGKISVESTVGKGTRFTLQLPIANQNEAPLQ